MKKHCEYKAMLKKTDIEPMVIEAIREIVRNEEYEIGRASCRERV